MTGFDKLRSRSCGIEVGLVLIGNALKRLWPEYEPKTRCSVLVRSRRVVR